MLQQMVYFVSASKRFLKRRCVAADDGRARMEGREDICRQSLSRQMSDNTIVWWVWMTGSFVSFLSSSSSFIFSFLRFIFFARLVSKVTTVSQYSVPTTGFYSRFSCVYYFEFLLIFYTTLKLLFDEKNNFARFKVPAMQTKENSWSTGERLLYLVKEFQLIAWQEKFAEKSLKMFDLLYRFAMWF